MSFARFTALPRQSRSVLSSLVNSGADPRMPFSPAGRLRAWHRALGSLWRERLDILDYLKTGDEGLAQSLRQRFGLGPPLRHAQPIPEDLFDTGPTPERSPATIIIPVFRAETAVARLLKRLPSTLPPDQAVIVVDDGSESPRIDALLAEFGAAHPASCIVRHARNRGFVAAANTGFAMLERGHHAILLNSDTLPPEGWVPRLLAPIAGDASVATVTPLSNAAEILSVPCAGLGTALTSALVDRADGVARQFRTRPVDLPTGVGFCMALNRRFLDRVGPFDSAFGRGYGEEVDWCQRATAAGGRHVTAVNLFVGHDGGASFGAAARSAGVIRAGRRINARYPRFAAAARDWDSRDPIAPERLAVALAWLAEVTEGPVPIYIAHALGGGAETALQEEIRAHLTAGHPAVILLRAGGPARWRVEMQGARLSLAGDVASDAMLHRLLAPVTEREVIYSCAVGSADPAAVPGMLLDLSQGMRLEMRLHDFFPISPSWNLLGSDGRFRGVPAPDSIDPAHTVQPSASHPGLSHAEWRAAWARVIGAASEITVFARSGRALIEAAYLQARGKTVLRPHPLQRLPEPVAPGGASIGVLGGINQAKGGAVLERLAQATARRIVVIGEMDGRFRLPAPHIVHGRYDRDRIAALARDYDIGVWFLPSVCPETFSFATHEALATGLPVACFDLGAQAEALRDAARGHVLTQSPEDTAGIAAALERLFSASGTGADTHSAAVASAQAE